MQMLLFLILFIVFIIKPTLRFLIKYSKEQSINKDIANFIHINNELARHSNNPGAFRRLNRLVSNGQESLLGNFLTHRKIHQYLCINFINMMKENATNTDIGYMLKEMEAIREEYNKTKNIDILLFPAIIEPENGIKLFQDFQNKIQECERVGNVPKGYAYMAWSITLIAHINLALSSLGIMLWQELRKGFEDYEKITSKSWKNIPRF